MFLRFLFSTGCRVSEMCGIRLRDIENQGATEKIRITGKGNKERFIRIRIDLCTEIQQVFKGSTLLFETSRQKPYNRSYVSNQIKKLGKAFLGRKISAHSLRHSFATIAVGKYPGKLDAVSHYLGHSSTSITLNMYCHNQLSDEELFSITVI